MARLELKIRDIERLVEKLALENEMLGKGRDLNTRGKKRVYLRYLKRLRITKEECKIMVMPRSTYYNKPKEAKISDMDLVEKTEEITLDFLYYVYGRITIALHR